MPHMRLKRENIVKILLLLAALSVSLMGIGAISFWENRQQEEAMWSQSEKDQAARRRREGWIQKDGVWYAPKQNLQTVLVIGLDEMGPLESSESYNNGVQADFLLLAALDSEDKTATLLHLNRDTMAQIPVLGVTGQAAGSTFGQLALAYTYGSGLHDSCRNTVQAVSELLHGVSIDHYIVVSMGAVPTLNDLVGGVTVTVLDDFSALDEQMVQGKTITLTGEQALQYVHRREGLEDSSNRSRMERQQQYLKALAKQVKQLGEQPSLSAQQLASLSRYILSDCTLDALSRMTEQFAGYSLQPFEEVVGELRNGEMYLEFYPDADRIEQQVLRLFYEERR